MVDFDKAISPHIVDDPQASLLYKPFAKFPDAVAAADRARLVEAGRQAIVTSVVPGYRKLLTFLRDQYVPACREQIGAAPCRAVESSTATGCVSSPRSTSTRSKSTTWGRPRCGG